MENNVATAPSITKEIVIGTINIALTRAQMSLQSLNDAEQSLVYNEDHLPEIADFLSKSRKAKAIIDNEHKTIKEPYLRQCQVIDESKRSMHEQIDGSIKIASEKYTALCQAVEKRKRDIELDNQRKQQIQSGIDSNMISFSGKIADCKTNSELLSIERLINLEKANKTKYQEFYEVAVEKYSSLTALITSQKEAVKEFEKLEQQRIEAEKKGDDEKLIALQEQQFKLSQRIDETKVNVQETAVNQSTQSVVTTAEEILPNIKARRTAWTWEISNIKEVAKKMPDWCEITTIDSKIDDFLKASKAQWDENSQDNLVVNGIKFFKKITY